MERRWKYPYLQNVREGNHFRQTWDPKPYSKALVLAAR
jgi:hypothetical protein